MHTHSHRSSLLMHLAWRLSEVACVGLLATAAYLATLVGLSGAHSLGWAGQALIRVDALSVLMLSLLSFLAWVIVRYARVYLEGEARHMHFLGWLLATVAAVAILVLADNLLLLSLAWTCTGLTLHPLLTFYRERRGAMLAAHKKFLLSRLADAAMLGATALVWQTLGTADISQIAPLLADAPPTPLALHGAAALIGLAVMLKCAQLPFHGWLIQVMEAPTPVSALLHAGIVNMGGYVLIRLSPLMSQAPEVQMVLAWVGGITMLLAALVAMTRISIKVQLAWSTCAQMGFLVLECALGAYEVALLHLLAHSLYKAHAFLSSGQAAKAVRMRLSAPAAATASHWAWGARMAAGVGLAWAIHAALPASLAPSALSQPAHTLLYAALSLALGYRLTLEQAWSDALSRIRSALTSCAQLILMASGYLVLHKVCAMLLALPPAPIPTGAIMAAAICLSMLLVAQCCISLNPSGRLSSWLYPKAYAGFHLDEGFTRFTQWLWPASLPSGSPAPRSSTLSTTEHAA